MVTKVICDVWPGGMRAANAIEAEKLEQFRGEQVMVSISKPRNLQFHRKFFAMLGVAHDMADTGMNAEQFRHYVIVGSGHCDFIEYDDGRMIAVPKSISFATMDESEFERLYKDVLNFICGKWVMNPKQMDEIVRFL